MPIPAPKVVEKFFTPQFLNMAPPAIAHGVKLVPNIREVRGFPKEKDGKDVTKDVMAVDVEYQGTEYTYKGDEAYKVLYSVLKDNETAWKGATFDAQAVQYERLKTSGFVPIANTIQPGPLAKGK